MRITEGYNLDWEGVVLRLRLYLASGVCELRSESRCRRRKVWGWSTVCAKQQHNALEETEEDLWDGEERLGEKVSHLRPKRSAGSR